MKPMNAGMKRWRWLVSIILQQEAKTNDSDMIYWRFRKNLLWKKKKKSLMWHLLETKSINILYLYDFVFCVITYEMKLLSEVSLVGDDALCKLADMDEKQWEGEDPSQVVAGEMKPCVMMDLHLGALTAPTWERQTDKQTDKTDTSEKKKKQPEWRETR